MKFDTIPEQAKRGVGIPLIASIEEREDIAYVYKKTRGVCNSYSKERNYLSVLNGIGSYFYMHISKHLLGIDLRRRILTYLMASQHHAMNYAKSGSLLAPFKEADERAVKAWEFFRFAIIFLAGCFIYLAIKSMIQHGAINLSISGMLLYASIPCAIYIANRIYRGNKEEALMKKFRNDQSGEIDKFWQSYLQHLNYCVDEITRLIDKDNFALKKISEDEFEMGTYVNNSGCEFFQAEYICKIEAFACLKDIFPKTFGKAYWIVSQ